MYVHYVLLYMYWYTCTYVRRYDDQLSSVQQQHSELLASFASLKQSFEVSYMYMYIHVHSTGVHAVQNYVYICGVCVQQCGAMC